MNYAATFSPPPPPPPPTTATIAITGNNIISTWGANQNHIWGQSFIAPSPDNLTDFTFNIGYGGLASTGTTDYKAYVYAWNGSSVVGNPLYESAVSSLTAPNFTLAPFTVNTGGVALTAGQQYVAFLEAVGPNNLPNGFNWSVNTNDQYANGSMVGGQTIGSLANIGGGSIFDLAFTANFSAVTAVNIALGIHDASDLGSSLNPAFAGGVLRFDQSSQTYAQNFTATGTGNAIDTNGNTNTLSGNITNLAAGTPIDLAISDTGTGGVLNTSGAIGTNADPLGIITNTAIWNLNSGGSVYANGINNSGTFNVANGATVVDDLNNTGTFNNSGNYTANITNDTAAGIITNTSTGVITGDLLSNTNGASVTNAGAWTGSANNSSLLTNAAGGTWTGDLTNDSTGTLTNAGSWNGVIGNSGTVINSATGTIVTISQTDGSTTNAGTITDAVGIGGGSLTNSGLIDSLTIGSGVSITGNATVTNLAGGTIGTNANSIHGIWTNTAATIVNSGTITAGQGPNARAISAVDGTITNNSGAHITGQEDGVYSTGTLILTNAGTITGTDNYGIYSGGDANVINSGTITGNNGGIYNVGNLLLTNSGTISAASDAVRADGVGSIVVNSGTISSTVNSGVVVGRRSTVTNAAAGTLTGGSNSNFGYGAQMAGGSGTLNNYGTLNGSMGGILSNENLGSSAPGDDLAINLFAGSTTGNINLANNTGPIRISLFSGLGSSNLGLNVGGVQLQNAGPLAAAVFGNIIGGTGGRTSLILDGSGGTGAAAGNLNLANISNIDELVKTGTGNWNLTGLAALPSLNIYAGLGSPGGILSFGGTSGIAGDIFINGSIVRATSAGAFGTGTIHMIDPTVQFLASGTYANNFSLEVATGQVGADPATFEAGTGTLVFLSGAITQSGAPGVDPNQDFVKSGTGTLVLQNAANNWTGVTRVLTGGRLAGTTSSISGSSIVNSGILEYNQTTSGSVNKAITTNSLIEVRSLLGGNNITFGGNIANGLLANISAGKVTLSGANNSVSVTSNAIANSAVELSAGASNVLSNGLSAFNLGNGATFTNFGTASSTLSTAATINIGAGGATITNNLGATISNTATGKAISASAGSVFLNNLGTISTTAQDIAVSIAGAGFSTVANSGTIRSNLHGVFLANGNLTNSATGLIEANGPAAVGSSAVWLGTTANNALITNDGQIVSNADGGNGILIDSSNATVQNNATGVIQANNATGSWGLGFSTSSGNVNNAGLITGEVGIYGQNGLIVNNSVSGTIRGATTGVRNFGSPISVTNHGLIEGGLVGVYADVGGTIVNEANGTIRGGAGGNAINALNGLANITNRGLIDTPAATGASGVVMQFAGANLFNNSGTVNGGNNGVFIAGGTIDNSGTITGTRGNGIRFTNVIAPGTLNNTGTVQSLAAGLNAVLVESGGSNINNLFGGQILANTTAGSNSAGVNITGAGGTLTNMGAISGDIGVRFGALGNLNTFASSIINGTTTGLLIDNAFVNLNLHGTLSGGVDAIKTIGDFDNVINLASDLIITGNLATDLGDDTINVFTTLNGGANLGAGNDIYNIFDGGSATALVDGGAGSNSLVFNLAGSANVNMANFANFTSRSKNGAGVLTLGGIDALSTAFLLNGGSLVLAGGQAINDAARIVTAGGTNLIITANEGVGSLVGDGAINLTNFTLTTGLDNTDTSYNGLINGGGSSRLVKAGAGTFFLTNANNVFGELAVDAGALDLSGGYTGTLTNSATTMLHGNVTGTVTNLNGALFEVTGNSDLTGSTVYNEAGGRFIVDFGQSLLNVATFENYSNALGSGLDVFGTLGIQGTLYNGNGADIASLLVRSGATVNAGGIVNAAGSVITVENGGTVVDDLDNSGTVNNSGSYIANATNQSGGIINNLAGADWTGNLDNSDGGLVTNDGLWTGNITNSGEITNSATGQIFGQLLNQATATLSNFGLFEDNTIPGTNSQNHGNLYNNASATMRLNIANFGNLVNFVGGDWFGDLLGTDAISQVENQANWTGNANNSGTLRNTGGSLWTGDIVNNATGSILNDGTFDGDITNAGSFIQGPNGTTTGLLTNSGTAGFSGLIDGGLLQTGGTSTNDGTINNGANILGGTFNTQNILNGGLTNAGTTNAFGTINGIINNNNSGIFNVLGPLVGNSNFINNGSAQLLVNHIYSGLTGLINNSTSVNGVVVNGTLNVSGNVNNNAGFITIGSSGSLIANNVNNAAGAFIFVSAGGQVTDLLTNNGNVVNGGTYNADVINSGAAANIFNQTTGIWNGNVVSNDTNANLTNDGIWNGNLTSSSGAINNHGTWTGIATNSGTSQIFNTAGTWNGDLVNSGYAQNDSGGVWNGVATNAAAGTIINGSIWNGAADNLGQISNTLSSVWNGDISNRIGAQFVSFGTVTGNANNYGLLSNSGTWGGTLTNNAGTTANGGVWNGNATVLGGTLQNNNNFNGTVTNHSTFTNLASGNVSGLVTNVAGFASNAGTWGAGYTGLGGTGNNSGSVVGDVLINSGAGFITTFQVLGALTNSGIVNASGTITGQILNQGAGVFATTAGGLNAQSVFNNNGAALLDIQTGNLTGTVVNNNSTAATGVRVGLGLGLSATSVNNAVGSTIRNLGTLSTSAGLNNLGTLLSNNTIDGGLNNSGTSSIMGIINGAIVNQNNGLFSVAGNLVGNSGFTNSGTAMLQVTGGNFTGLTSLVNSSTFDAGVLVGATLNVAGNVTNSGIMRVISGGRLQANNISNALGGLITVAAGGQVIDALTNSGTVINAGTYTADVNNSGTTALVENSVGGTWNGNVLSNTAGGTVNNFGTWNGTINSAANFGNGATGIVSGLVTNSGTAVNNGTLNGGLLNTAGTSANSGTINAGVAVTGGTVGSTGVINGGVSTTAGATIQAQNQINGAITNAGNFFVTGALTNNASSFANAATGVLSVGGNSFTGLGAITNAAGGQIGVGSSTVAGTLGGVSLANSGLVTMLNNRVGDRVNLSGAYSGASGSIAAFDVNMSNNSNQSDKITANGQSGNSAIAIKNVGASKIYLGSPIILIQSATGSGTYTANNDADTAAALASVGIVDYSLKNTSAGDWGIVSTINNAAASGVTAGAADFMTSVLGQYSATDYFMPSSITKDKKWTGRVWGQISTSSTSNDHIASSSDAFSAKANIKADIDMTFVRFGADGNFHTDTSDFTIGFDGGTTKGSSKAQSTTGSADYDLTFYGVHSNLESSIIDIDFAAAKLNFKATPSSLLSNSDLEGDGTILSLALAKRIDIKRVRLEPYLKLSRSSLSLDDLALTGGIGSLTFPDMENQINTLGLKVSREYTTPNANIRPFVEFGFNNSSSNTFLSEFIPTGGAANVRLSATQAGDYGHINAGFNSSLRNSGLELFGKVEAISGSNTSGYAASLGARMRF